MPPQSHHDACRMRLWLILPALLCCVDAQRQANQQRPTLRTSTTSTTPASIASDYEVPKATVEVLSPKGFTVSIPHNDGIELFAFHGNVNKPIPLLDGGTYSRDVAKPKDNRWTYVNSNVRLNRGDKIYYWLYVQFDGVGYRRDEQVFTYAGTAGNPGAVCSPTNTTVGGKASCAGVLIFSEDFNVLDTNTRWQHDVRIPHGPDWEFVSHLTVEETSNIDAGHLVLRPTLLEEIYPEPFFVTKGRLELEACTGKPGTEECTKQATGGRNILPPVVIPRIRTKNAFSFRYGRIEVRAKMPVGDWIFPELWLSPKDRNYGVDYESGQIRLAFSRGNENLNARAGTHIGNKLLEAGCLLGITQTGKLPVVKRHLMSKLSNVPWSSSFRNYTLMWTPDEMVFGVDGEIYSTVKPPDGGFKNFPEFSGINRNPWESGTKMAPFDKEFYLRIGVGVGGIRAFPELCTNRGKPKPWLNTDPKAMALFWRDRSNWYPTWSNTELRVDHVKIWAL